RATAWMPRVSPITPPPPIRLPVSIESVRPSVPASASAATMQPAIAAPPGRLRLAMMAVWNFLLTTGAFVLFAAVWFLAVTALREHELDQFYLACAATVAVTPVAMHRIMGSRGSLRFSVLGSIVASLATVYLLTDNPAADAETSLAALFMAQLVAVVLAEILTRRRTLEDLEEDLFPVSEG